MRGHLLEQHARAADVVFVVAQRHFSALADLRKRGEVNNAVDFFLFEYLREKRRVTDIALVKAAGRRDRRAEAGAEVVGDDNAVSGFKHRPNRVRADISGTAGY